MRIIMALLLASACTLARSQSATVQLTHDDADGVVEAGDTVVWTLSLAFEDAGYADSGNMRLVAKDPTLAESSDFVFFRSKYGYTDAEGVENNGDSDGDGGIRSIAWINPFTFHYGDFAYDLSNPFIIGRFTTRSLRDGFPDFDIELGGQGTPFLRLGISIFQPNFDLTREQAGYEVEPFEPLDPSEPSAGCVYHGWEPESFRGGLDGPVDALLALPDGSILVGGSFTQAGRVEGNAVARWDGSSWHALDTGFNRDVLCFATLPNGDLVAGGKFNKSGERYIYKVARWHSEKWLQLGDGLRGNIRSFVVTPSGELIAGGSIRTANAVQQTNVIGWDGTSWSPLAQGPGGAVHTLAILPDGTLVAGGLFGVSVWDGQAWERISGAANIEVYAMAVDANDDLIVGGYFERIGQTVAYSVARWDGLLWHAIGDGIDGDVISLAVVEGEILAGSDHWSSDHLHRWNGSRWLASSNLGDGEARVFAKLPSGDLIVGGAFAQIESTAAGNLARLNKLSMRIIEHPVSVSGCLSAYARFTARAEGPSPLGYRWETLDLSTPTGWGEITDGTFDTLGGLATVRGATTPQLELLGVTQSMLVRCVVIGECGQVPSDPAELMIDLVGCCQRVDFNADGVLDSTDIAAFVSAFINADPSADLNSDRVLDLGDIEAFVFLYLAGCG